MLVSVDVISSLYSGRTIVSQRWPAMAKLRRPIVVRAPVPSRLTEDADEGFGEVVACIQFAVLPYTRVRPHLAQISGINLSFVIGSCIADVHTYAKICKRLQGETC